MNFDSNISPLTKCLSILEHSGNPLNATQNTILGRALKNVRPEKLRYDNSFAKNCLTSLWAGSFFRVHAWLNFSAQTSQPLIFCFFLTVRRSGQGKMKSLLGLRGMKGGMNE